MDSIWRFTAPELYSIADLHGDLNQTVGALKLANLVDEKLNWIGEKAILVQTGDIVDRGEHSAKIYDLFRKLKKEAQTSGGDVLQLLGNHEIMNINEEYTYVTEKELDLYGGREKRMIAWGAEGKYGKYLRQLPMAIIVNDIVFSHAGIAPEFAEKGLKYLNEQLNWILNNPKAELKMEQYKLMGNDGPFWTRAFDVTYSGKAESEICKYVENTLSHLNAKHMVVGHNVQPKHDEKILCDGKLFEMDVGLSKAYGGKEEHLVVFHQNSKKIEIIHHDRVDLVAEFDAISSVSDEIVEISEKRKKNAFNLFSLFEHWSFELKGLFAFLLKVLLFLLVSLLVLFCFYKTIGYFWQSNQEKYRDYQLLKPEKSA